MVQDIAREPDAEQPLTLHIAGGQPLQAGQIGELLSCLARDYRRVNRSRTLVALSISSEVIALADAEPAKGRKALLDFARALRELIHSTKHPDIDLRPRREGPHRSVDAMLRLVAESGAGLTIRHIDARGLVLDTPLTPADAQDIQHRARQAEFEAGFGRGPAGPKRGAYPRAARKWADQIEQLALPGSLEPMPLISTIVRLLCDSRNAYLVEMLAQELEGRDFGHLAAAVRAEGSVAPGDHMAIRR